MSKYVLQCGKEAEYTLTREGEEWRQVFQSMHKALDYAQDHAENSTPLVVLSPEGKEIVRSTIYPAPQRRAPVPRRDR